jgi:membrane associated rhomboid family serine protease
VGLIIFLGIVLVIVWRLATPEEGARAMKTGLALFDEVKAAAVMNREKCEPFFQSLRARTPRVWAVPAIVALNVLVFGWMTIAESTPEGVDGLVGWGASYGPSTANGEWWRLLTAMFVHASLTALIVNSAALIQIGLILERLVGRVTFAMTYVAAGMFANLASLAASPMTVASGGSGAVSGVFGLMAVSFAWLWWTDSEIRTPRAVFKRLTPITAIFFMYSSGNGSLASFPEFLSLAVGAASGLVLLRGISAMTAPPRRIAAATAATLTIAAAAAVPLRGLTDVRPEIGRLAALETRMATTYESAATKFKKRHMTAEALAAMIDQEILPGLGDAEVRLNALERVPPEHRPLVSGASEYVRLRAESWRLRAASLRKFNAEALRKTVNTDASSTENARRKVETSHQSNLFALSKADAAERAALHALEALEALTRVSVDQSP